MSPLTFPVQMISKSRTLLLLGGSGGWGWDTLTVAIWGFISGTRNGLALARRAI